MAYTEKQKEYSLQYAREKLKRVPLDLKKEEYEYLSEAAKAAGKSINGYIKEAIKEKISQDKADFSTVIKFQLWKSAHDRGGSLPSQ